MKCAICREKKCYTGKDCSKILEKSQKSYQGSEMESMKASTHIESRYYMQKTRLEELIMFAKTMKYKTLGIAFCIGFENEAEILHEILKKNFQVYSVCCKICGIDKSELDLERLHGDEGTEAMCNPIGQAMVLNDLKTDLNIILGLCIGHDILFTKYSESPVTTFAVKDRVLTHNPLGAIYSKYYLEGKFGLKRNDNEIENSL